MKNKFYKELLIFSVYFSSYSDLIDNFLKWQKNLFKLVTLIKFKLFIIFSEGDRVASKSAPKSLSERVLSKTHSKPVSGKHKGDLDETDTSSVDDYQESFRPVVSIKYKMKYKT